MNTSSRPAIRCKWLVEPDRAAAFWVVLIGYRGAGSRNKAKSTGVTSSKRPKVRTKRETSVRLNPPSGTDARSRKVCRLSSAGRCVPPREASGASIRHSAPVRSESAIARMRARPESAPGGTIGCESMKVERSMSIPSKHLTVSTAVRSGSYEWTPSFSWSRAHWVSESV